jgi:TolA-binding protein
MGPQGPAGPGITEEQFQALEQRMEELERRLAAIDEQEVEPAEEEEVEPVESEDAEDAEAVDEEEVEPVGPAEEEEIAPVEPVGAEDAEAVDEEEVEPAEPVGAAPADEEPAQAPGRLVITTEFTIEDEVEITVTGPDGYSESFVAVEQQTLGGLVPGSYTVTADAPELEEQEVEIEAGETATVSIPETQED